MVAGAIRLSASSTSIASQSPPQRMTPVGDVSGLAFRVLTPVSIVDRAGFQTFLDKSAKGRFFADPGVRPVCVAEDEDGEAVRRLLGKSTGHRGKRGCHVLRVLIVDGSQQGGPGWTAPRFRRAARANKVDPELPEKTESGLVRCEADPGEVDREDN